MIAMEKIDKSKFEHFANRCFINGNDKCLYIDIGEYKDPMKLTDAIPNWKDYQGMLKTEAVLDILQEAANGSRG